MKMYTVLRKGVISFYMVDDLMRMSPFAPYRLGIGELIETLGVSMHSRSVEYVPIRVCGVPHDGYIMKYHLERPYVLHLG